MDADEGTAGAGLEPLAIRVSEDVMRRELVGLDTRGATLQVSDKVLELLPVGPNRPLRVAFRLMPRQVNGYQVGETVAGPTPVGMGLIDRKP